MLPFGVCIHAGTARVIWQMVGHDWHMNGGWEPLIGRSSSWGVARIWMTAALASAAFGDSYGRERLGVCRRDQTPELERKQERKGEGGLDWERERVQTGGACGSLRLREWTTFPSAQTLQSFFGFSEETGSPSSLCLLGYLFALFPLLAMTLPDFPLLSFPT